MVGVLCEVRGRRDGVRQGAGRMEVRASDCDDRWIVRENMLALISI